MVEQVQVDAPIEHSKHWKVPEMVEPALKYTAPSGRHSTEAAKETSSNDWKPTKWYLSLNMNFCMSTSHCIKADLAVTFRLEVLKSIDTH